MFEFILGMLILATPVTTTVEYVQPPEPIVREVVAEDNSVLEVTDLMFAVAYGENNFSFDSFYYTICTMYNRLNRGYGNGNIERMLDAYNASPIYTYNKEWAIWVNENLYRCPTDILYALSYNDILYLGFDMDNATYIVGNVESCSSYVKNKIDNWQCVYFYSKWYG